MCSRRYGVSTVPSWVPVKTLDRAKLRNELDRSEWITVDQNGLVENVRLLPSLRGILGTHPHLPEKKGNPPAPRCGPCATSPVAVDSDQMVG